MRKFIVNENDLDTLVMILETMEQDIVRMTPGNVSHHAANMHGVVDNMIQLIGDMKKGMSFEKEVLKEWSV